MQCLIETTETHNSTNNKSTRVCSESLCEKCKGTRECRTEQCFKTVACMYVRLLKPTQSNLPLLPTILSVREE